MATDPLIKVDQPLEKRIEINQVPGDPFYHPSHSKIADLTARLIKTEAANERLISENAALKKRLGEFEAPKPKPGEHAVQVYIPFVARPVTVHFEPPEIGIEIKEHHITRVDLNGCDISRPRSTRGLDEVAEAVNIELAAMRTADEYSRAESILASLNEPIV